MPRTATKPAPKATKASKEGGRRWTKAQLAEAEAKRQEGRAIRAYLEALEATQRSGRRRDPERIKVQLKEIAEELASCDDSVRRVSLLQRRLDLQSALDQPEGTEDLSVLEAAFVEVLVPYSQRKGICYRVWREVGVPVSVLRSAHAAEHLSSL